MRKLFIGHLTILALLSTTAIAQNYYKCDGFNATPVPISEGLELSANWEEIDSITFAEPQFKEVKIVYDGTTATVTIPSNVKGVTCTSGSSSHVIINSTTSTDEYLYTISGKSTDGSLTLNGSYKLTLKLNGVNLKSSKGAAIDIECGKRIDIIAADGTDNTFEDSQSGTHKAAFYSKGHVELKGGGNISITGNTGHAFAAKEYFIIKASFTGLLNIPGAQKDGIHCGKGEKGDGENNYFQMNGGTLTISSCGSDCIDTDDYGCAYIKGGNITMNISQEDGTGLKVDSLLTLSGGTITANISGVISDGIRCSYLAKFSGGKYTADVSGNGSRGIRGKNTTSGTVLAGGNLTFSGADISMTVSGGTYTAESQKCFGIKADKVLTQTAGDITISVTNSAAKDIKAGTDTWTGGTRNGKLK